MSAVALMGAQALGPTVREVATRLHARGPFAVITAGWQERENEDDELRAHLGEDVVNLALDARARTALDEDPELAQALRARQERLRHLQSIYRIRLKHAFAAELDVSTYRAPEELRVEIDDASIAVIRALDEDHLAHCARLREEFEEAWKPIARAAVARQIDEIRDAIESCKTICIAGGHVAVLRNRMDLFQVPDLFGARPLLAWSAGAMVLTDRIVLFHDDAPQGGVLREVLDFGFGRASDCVALPELERRLETQNVARMRHLARRFAPARCLLLPASSYALFRGDEVEADGVAVVGEDGVPVALREPNS